MDAQLKKGVLSIAVLKILEKEDRYGYDIVKQLTGLFPDTDESTFYSVFRRLKNEGLTEVYYGVDSNGPQRKYYRITELGRQGLANYLDSFEHIIEALKHLGITL